MKRFEVWWVPLDPAAGSEMRKTRPCVIVSRDAKNERLRTVIVAPLTRGGFAAPFRVACRIAGQDGQISLDQLRVVDKARLVRRLAILDARRLRQSWPRRPRCSRSEARLTKW